MGEPEPEEEHDMCCCCVCQCSTEETKDLSCCACFPIKCGLIVVGIIYCTLTVAMFIELFYGFINEQIHWWYPVVGILLMVPLIIGLCFYIRFFTKDETSTKKAFAVWFLFIVLIINFSYAYFMCVARSYAKTMDGGEPESLDMPASPF